jgi:prefoldin subunit 5
VSRSLPERTSVGVGGLVPSWLAALESKESAARSRAGELRERIAELTGALTLVESELSRLQITRETMTEVLADGPGRAVPVPVGDAESAVVPLAELAPVLLAAEASGDMTVTSQAYRRILVVFAQAPGPLRCKDVCAGVGLGTAANHIETMRSKLKRLVERQILVEAGPGLFAPASRAGAR